MGEAGDTCGRPQRNGLGSSSCWEKEKARLQLVVNEWLHAQR
jgi:hypothetical protein